MAKYAARHHVGLGDYTARPGEVIGQELSDEQEKWLLSIGAIDPLPYFYAETPDMDGGQQEPEDAPEQPEDELEQQEEGQEDEQPPEIDVMDGIASEAAQDEPKKKGGKRK